MSYIVHLLCTRMIRDGKSKSFGDASRRGRGTGGIFFMLHCTWLARLGWGSASFANAKSKIWQLSRRLLQYSSVVPASFEMEHQTRDKLQKTGRIARAAASWRPLSDALRACEQISV